MNRLMIRHTMDKPLPYDAEVEYLESSGTQYIDTGISGSSAISISLDILLPDITNSGGFFFGSRTALNNKAYNLVLSKVYTWRYGSGSNENSFDNTSDRRLRFDNTSVHNEMRIYEGDTLISTLTAPSYNFENYRNLYLFAGNNADNLSICAGLRLYGCKMYRNSVIIRDFIPVRKGNTGYLYDKVSGKLFGNQGTGDFVVGPDYNPFAYQYLTFVPLEDSTFSFSKRGTGNDIEYSIDGGAWTSLASDANTPTVGAGHNIRWRAELLPSPLNTNEPGIGVFSSSSKFNIAGNVASLLFGDSFVGQPTLLREASYYYLFSNSKVVDASAMALTIPLAKRNCYQGMFEGCALLTDAPELKYITANNDYVFSCMFRFCVSLVNAPRHVNANGWSSCESMFAGCTSLVVAPSLPATKLASYCYRYMFQGCTSLRIAPVLPAASISTNYCYQQMFSGCTSLDYVKCLATSITGSNVTASWLLNVSPTGTFVKAAGMNDWTTGSSGIPDGWTVVDDPSTINS